MELSDLKKVTLTVPIGFGFKDYGIFDFDKALQFFDWTLKDCRVIIDAYGCDKANYQAMALLPLYLWHLRSKNCFIDFNFKKGGSGAYAMWSRMGAQGWHQVLMKEQQNFIGHVYKPLIAIRNNNDFKMALKRAESYTNGFNVEYEKTLRYVISELLYNTIEHGRSVRYFNGQQKVLPSVIQFTWYQKANELHFIIADLGIGIKKHLEQTYPSFDSNTDAIFEAIKYNVSGTFGITDPYKSKDNAGVGLFISSNIIQKLDADMHILSGDGLVHISPRDITRHSVKNSWPGTLILVSLRLGKKLGFNLHNLMAELRMSAKKEVDEGEIREKENTHYLSIKNYFGNYAEDKEGAIKYREKYLLSTIEKGHSLIIDFKDVKSAPHSFLSALLATPIKRLGMKAYKQIRIVNSEPEIRETIDYILDDNTT